MLLCACLSAAAACCQVCSASGIERRDISYVEAHGTGTVVGDAQELAAIDFVYGSGVRRSAADPLLIGSVKSNMGHCEGCSGLAGGQWAAPEPCSCLCLCMSMADRVGHAPKAAGGAVLFTCCMPELAPIEVACGLHPSSTL